MSSGGNGGGDGTMWASVLHAGLAGTFLKVPYVEAKAERLKEQRRKAEGDTT